MKHAVTFILFLLFAYPGRSQITLDSCKVWARSNYPVIKQFDLVEQSRRLTVSNAAKAWLPRIELNAGASYQSDVTTLPISIPDIDLPDGPSKDQYDARLTISQQIYDGGAVASAKSVANAQSDVEREKVNVAMYDIYERIEQIYFGILVLDEQLKVARLLQKDRALSNASVTSMMKNGVASQTDVDAVAVEQVKARQTEISILVSRNTYIKMLETFVGKKFRNNDTLVKPAVSDFMTITNNRPELALYNARDRLLDTRLKALDVSLRPQLGVFASGGYGNPALNMLKNDFDSYYKIGATLSWNFGALYTRSNDKRKIEAERQTIQSEREAFLFNTSLQTELQSGVIDNLKKQLEQDDEIITLRRRIRNKAETRVANGTETVNEMLRDINAESNAILNKRLHEIQLLQEIYKLKTINNF